jgi:hypothetical protein
MAAYIIYFSVLFSGPDTPGHLKTGQNTPKMASNLACEGLLAKVSLLEPFGALTTGLDEAVTRKFDF